MSSVNADENSAHRKPKGSYGRSFRVGLVGPKPRAKAVGDGQLVSIPAPPVVRYGTGVTQEDRWIGPSGHGPSPTQRHPAAGKSTAGLSGGVGASRDVSQRESVDSMLARKASVLAPQVPVPQTATGRWE